MDQKLYMHAYMDGYNAALKEAKEGAAKPYIDKDGIIERYDRKIGISKAGEIIRAVRNTCNGGKLDSCSLVLRSEYPDRQCQNGKAEDVRI